MNGPTPRSSAPFRIAALYFTVSTAWIYLSDRLLPLLAGEGGKVALWQTAKGSIFVALTSALIYLLVRRAMKKEMAAADTLRQKEEILGQIVAETSDAVFVKDRQGRYLLLNAATAAVFGKSADEIEGKTDRELFPPEEAGQIVAGDRRIMDDGVRTYEEALTASSGEQRIYLTTKGPLHNRQGEVAGLFGIARDVTERKRTEEKVRTLNLRLQLLVRVVQDLSRTRSLEEIMAIVHRGARELVGADGASFILREGDLCYYAQEEAVETVFRGKRFPMSQCIGGWAMLNRSATAIEDISGDERIPYEAYRPSYIRSLAVVPIRREDPLAAVAVYWGAPRRTSAEELDLLQTLADATSVAMENVQIYAELEQRVSDRTLQLQAANRDLNAFSYSVSHDLRAPLRAIDGFARILDETKRACLDEEGRQFLSYILEAAGRMDRLIDDLLTYSRLGERGVPLRPLSLQPILVSLRKELAVSSPEAAGALEIPSDLPVVLGDATLLRQIFANLLQNAFIYRRKDTPPRVVVNWEGGEGKAVVRVRDNGIGIPPEHREKIFAVFQRLHHQGDYPGTGIGLAIVRRSAELLGGGVWVESEPGEGSTFCVRLPLPDGSAERSN